MPEPTRVMVGARLAGLSSAGACKLLKRCISSQAIGPPGDYLGSGKGVIAEYLDLDRSTANRRVAKGQLLPIHSAERLLSATAVWFEHGLADRILRKPDTAPVRHSFHAGIRLALGQ